MKRSRVASSLLCAGCWMALSDFAVADPPVPCSTVGLIAPRVFCFRITDIKKEVDPIDDNTFTFELEVLNWTNQEAIGLFFALNVGSSPGVTLISNPSFPSNTDANLRPLGVVAVDEDTNGNCSMDAGEDANGNGRLDTPKPACFYNGVNPNNWSGTVTPSSVYFDGTCGTVIPFIDLIDCGGGVTQAQVFDRVPCRTSPDPLWQCDIDAAGNVLPAPSAKPGVDGAELIDDGKNVLDGFLLTIDGLNPHTIVSLNWFIMVPESGCGMPQPAACVAQFSKTYPAGTPGTTPCGNGFGYGVLNLTRVDTGSPAGPIFKGNTGFTQRDFFDSVYKVNPGFFAELGGGITAEFLNNSDNIFQIDRGFFVPKFDEVVSKWSQPPGGNRQSEDIPSNLDWPKLLDGRRNPDVVAADDFVSDGRPIDEVRFWGSYLDERFVPPQFGGPGTQSIDGWLLSFHGDTGSGQPDELLGLYFCPSERVRMDRTGSTGCDGHPVFLYQARLQDCCPIHIGRPDPRGHNVPATPTAFLEVATFTYWLGIQAVVGVTFDPVDCIERGTPNTSDGDFWGWHTSAENRISPAVQGLLIMEGEDWLYPPLDWKPVTPACSESRNMAFELLTTKSKNQFPGDCNQDGMVNLTDAVCVLNVLFAGIGTFPCGAPGPPEPDGISGPAAGGTANNSTADIALIDWNGDGKIDISDAVAMLQYLFLGGPDHAFGLGSQVCQYIQDCPIVCQ